MGTLLVAEISVRQDAEGRYCLNDIHKAAGGERRHEANLWLRSQQAHELCAELANTQIPVFTQRGRYGGTFAVKELVYAYAMWISPAFHLKVIRAYDTLQTHGVTWLIRHSGLANLTVGAGYLITHALGEKVGPTRIPA